VSREIPGYRLLRFLGGGSLFEVWEARPHDDIIPVAVKFIRPEALESPSALTLLKREARAGYSVRHPRIARVLKSNFADAPHYVVSELVPGPSLKDRIERSGTLGVRRAVWAARQAAEGLAALHKVGLIHADVKPDNLRLTTDGELKLVDFAFTHRLGENRKINGSRFVLGTANYAAPELCQFPVTEGEASDLFSLGTVLFECLTGRLPYRAATSAEALRLRRTVAPADLADEPEEYPSSVVEVVRSLLQRDPRDRPTAKRVVRQLVRIEVELMRPALVGTKS
jgi:serine/threonine protein kinase